MELQQDIEQCQTTCTGCKYGITWYQKYHNRLHHLDFFATYEAGSIFPCLADKIVEKYITGYRENNSAILSEEFENLMVPLIPDSSSESEDSE
jgi:hypothetical protein